MTPTEVRPALVGLRIADVPPVAEVSEVTLDHVMSNGQAALVWFEVSLGHIRLVLGSMRQYVIPGKVPGWPRTSHGFIPLVCSVEVHVYAHDHTSIVEQVVLYDVSD